jgi:hypothetical protein
VALILVMGSLDKVYDYGPLFDIYFVIFTSCFMQAQDNMVSLGRYESMKNDLDARSETHFNEFIA